MPLSEQSTSLALEQVNKWYPGGVHAVKDVDLTVENGEFLVFVGPSGCGKSTLLRMVAGLESIQSGTIRMGGRVINSVLPKDRDIAMVFQNYALYPTMRVYDNLAFPLKMRRWSKADIHAQVTEVAGRLGISDLLDRRPGALSGGQRQRVALGRAMVRSPRLFLMDEPLSNLDAKLRVEMREVIKEIQNSLGITTVYVTHDQEEAMAVSDRIAVMNAGVIQQIGSPKSLYQRPANLFVSTFIGRTNLLKATVVDNGGGIRFKDGLSLSMDNLTDDAKDGQEVIVSIRPEEFVIEEAGQEGLPATVAYNIFLGLNTHYFVDLADGERVEIIQESRIEEILKSGTPIKLGIKREKINVFTQDGSRSVIK